jgi:hypothetical protein
MAQAITDTAASAFLNDTRHPLLALHRAILDALRAQHESEFGAVSAGEFLQIVINGSAFQWLGPLSTLIAALDDVLDDPDATPDARIDTARSVVAMFGPSDPETGLGRNAMFDARYLPMLQTHPDIAVANGQVAQRVRTLIG